MRFPFILIILSLFAMLSTSSCATHVSTRPNQVTVIKTPPKHYKIVRVKGKHYYVWNGKHYRKTRKGYVFVRV